ncbi:MAG: hypothetical protein HY466_07165 [Deltaproteobacteria bacterium]|nr:hypothetical protein [Deltaproteobacteria bacterium]
MNKSRRMLIWIPLVVLAVAAGTGCAKSVKMTVIRKPDARFDFRAVNDVAVLPITAAKVDFGEVVPNRLPKIRALLAKMQGITRKGIVEGSILSKATKGFHYRLPNRKTTTVVLKLNFDQFDNGHQGMRAVSGKVPLVGRWLKKKGRAKVMLRAQVLHPQTQAVLTEFTALSFGDGGLVDNTGGFDSEVLYSAANNANEGMYDHLSKLIGNKYKRFANIRKKAKMGMQDQKAVIKEEKRELPKK